MIYIRFLDLALNDLVPDLAELECNTLLQLCSPRWPNNLALVV